MFVQLFVCLLNFQRRWPHTTTWLDTPTSLTKRTCTDRFLSHLAVHTYLHDTATATHSDPKFRIPFENFVCLFVKVSMYMTTHNHATGYTQVIDKKDMHWQVLQTMRDLYFNLKKTGWKLYRNWKYTIIHGKIMSTFFIFDG